MASPDNAPTGSAGTSSDPGTALRAELKQFIVDHLRIPDVDPADLPDDSSLVESGLDLDSIDMLELVTGVEKKYGLRFEDPELVQEVFTTVSSIANHIATHRGSA